MISLIPHIKLISFAAQFLYPLFCSCKTLNGRSDTQHKEAESQWLAYWVICFFINGVESILFPVLRFMPLYYEFKTVIILWLVTAKFQGALLLWTNLGAPFFSRLHTIVDQHTGKIVKQFSATSDKVSKKLESFDQKVKNASDSVIENSQKIAADE